MMLALLPTGDGDALVRLGEAPEPRPSPDEAVVAVEAVSLNRGEVFLLERPRRGWRPGKDVAGRVVRAAREGTGPVLGRRVVGHPPHGGWAERVAVPAASLAVVPAAISAETAATLPLAGLTALRLMRAAGPVTGRRMLLTGASGGVGHFVTELAAAAGAELTAVSASPERAERLRALGAAHVVPSLAEARGNFDIALESVGGPSLAQAFGLLGEAGRLIWFGQASREPARLDFFAHFGQTGSTIQHFHYEASATSVAGDLETLISLTAAGALHPEIGLRTDWTEAAAALAALRDRRVRGHAVLTLPTPTHCQGAQR
jgi:NADPH:quinone reductase-like Zn-dependent oxidoreductase